MHDIHASLDVRAPSGAPIAGGKARRRGVSYSTKTTIVVSECWYVANGRARGLHAVYHRRMCSFVFAKKALVKKSDVGRTSHRGCSLCGCLSPPGTVPSSIILAYCTRAGATHARSRIAATYHKRGHSHRRVDQSVAVAVPGPTMHLSRIPAPVGSSYPVSHQGDRAGPLPT